MNKIRHRRGPTKQPPLNHTVVPLNGRHYPVKIEWSDDGRLHLYGFSDENSKPVSYARRVNAIDYLYRKVNAST